MQVRVFKNLNKHCLSIIAKTGPYKGKVVAYARSVFVGECKFIVSQKSRERAVKEKVRNVHAFCEGELKDVDLIEMRYPIEFGLGSWIGRHETVATRRIRYNPFLRGEFFDAESEQAVHDCRCAFIGEQGMFADPITAAQSHQPQARPSKAQNGLQPSLWGVDQEKEWDAHLAALDSDMDEAMPA